MKLQELQHLAAAGVRVEITASDLLEVCTKLAARPVEQPEYIPVKQAADLYGRCEKSIYSDIQHGVIVGMKHGGVWRVETPATRARRLAQ